MKKTTFFLMITFVIALFSSCCSNKSTTLDFLQKDLVVVSLQGEHICCQNPQPPTMFFDTLESRVSGNTGCNRYFAQYQLSDSTVQFNMPGTTRMACDSAANSLELKMLEVLSLANHYEVTVDELILKNGDTVLAILKEMKRPEDRCCGGDGDEKCCKGGEERQCCEEGEVAGPEHPCCKGEGDNKSPKPSDAPVELTH